MALEVYVTYKTIADKSYKSDFDLLVERSNKSKLEQVFIELLAGEGYPYHLGNYIVRMDDEILIEVDLGQYLAEQNKKEGITEMEVQYIIIQLKQLQASDLYQSNKKIMRCLDDGFALNQEDLSKKDIWIYLIDY